MHRLDEAQRPFDVAMVVIAALTWGTIGVAVGWLYRVAETNSLSIGFLRLLLSAPVLLITARLLAGPQAFRIQPRHRWTLALIGGAFAGYQVAYFAAIPYLGVAAAVLINICSAPIFTALLARVFLGERLRPSTWLAVGGAVLGAGLLVGGAPQVHSMSDLFIGAALALTAGFSYSLVVLGARLIAANYHPVVPVALSFALGALLLLPAALTTGLVIDYPPLGWFVLLYLSIVPTALAYALYVRGMRSVRATTAATITLLEPLGSALLAILLLGERFTATGMIGAALLIASIVVIARR
ncbi:DMT family transporter [Chloroflexus sp.]|uniref:DMT family transporter n=1 Tax=Chloroflexus sp. TaxID=1904827 RepID=UPI00298F1C3B|nr:EamA family transporter [Chloroflexus sp.]MCS6888203.1 DMT family transporter [Chloroflexus sp.]MCX7860421.1 DMT family transporter [Chloroflexus sp.]MDW8403874.1 EamA family transporter [Chloroflexus sp.]